MLGYSMLGMVAWAQKLYLSSRLPLWSLPEDYRQLGGSMAWSCGNMRYTSSPSNHPHAHISAHAHPAFKLLLNGVLCNCSLQRVYQSCAAHVAYVAACARRAGWHAYTKPEPAYAFLKSSWWRGSRV